VLNINFFYPTINYKNVKISFKNLKLYYICFLFRKIQNNMIKVSESASKKIVDMMKDDGFDAAQDYVRVGVKSGGCSGLSYDLTFDKNIGENDKVFEDNNVKIAVEKKSFLYLAGTILEFSGGLNGKGFVFNNPNASRTCGCGESFSL
jgi:iron-sulfur cluster assembly protein